MYLCKKTTKWFDISTFSINNAGNKSEVCNEFNNWGTRAPETGAFSDMVLVTHNCNGVSVSDFVRDQCFTDHLLGFTHGEISKTGLINVGARNFHSLPLVFLHFKEPDLILSGTPSRACLYGTAQKSQKAGKVFDISAKE